MNRTQTKIYENLIKEASPWTLRTRRPTIWLVEKVTKQGADLRPIRTTATPREEVGSGPKSGTDSSYLRAA